MDTYVCSTTYRAAETAESRGALTSQLGQHLRQNFSEPSLLLEGSGHCRSASCSSRLQWPPGHGFGWTPCFNFDHLADGWRKAHQRLTVLRSGSDNPAGAWRSAATSTAATVSTIPRRLAMSWTTAAGRGRRGPTRVPVHVSVYRLRVQATIVHLRV